MAILRIPCGRLAIVVCLLLIDPARSLRLGKNSPTESSKPSSRRWGRNEPNEDEEEPAVDVSKLIGKTYTAASIAYGSALLVYGQHAPSQLQALTVMRIAGYPRLQTAAQDLQENIRQTRRAILRHAPSLLKMHNSLYNLSNRADTARDVMAKTRAAKADGIITNKEEKAIRKLQKQNLKAIRKDMKRIKRGSNSLVRVWDTLDLDEIWELFEDFIFMATAVLATGNVNSIVGIVFAKYCYFMNLGSLLLFTNEKLRYPISRSIMRFLPFLPQSDNEKDIEKELSEVAGASAFVVNYLVSAYLVFFRYRASIVLNSALMVALITLKGIARLTSRDFVDGRKGGLWMLSVSVLAIYCYNLANEGGLPLPESLSFLTWIENLVSNVVHAVDAHT